MMQEPSTTTDRLSDIIRVVQLTRRTGLLAIERDLAGGKLEEATITFIDGRVSDVQVGQRSGLEVFNWLSTWGPCRYSFNPLPSQGVSGSPFSLPYLTPETTSKPGNGHLHPVGPTNSIPQRVGEAENVLPNFHYVGLTRTHLHLFLLIDGRRTVSELTHLLGRKAEEVNELLSALERVGFIQR